MHVRANVAAAGGATDREASRSAGDLAALGEVGRALAGLLELPQLLEAIPRMAAGAVRGRAAILRLVDEASGALPATAAWGLEGGMRAVPPAAPGLGIEGAVALDGAPRLLQDAAGEAVAGALPGARSLLCVPFVIKHRVIGTLTVVDRMLGDGGAGSFSAHDLQLLSALADQASVALEYARLSQDAQRLARGNQERVQKISILNEIGLAMRGTMDADRLLRIILTGATVGGGLAFNRAVLFLVDEPQRALQGMMGVGAATGEEAEGIWRGLAPPGASLAETIERLAGAHPAGSAFDAMARSLRVPLGPEGGIVALTALEGRPLRVTRASGDPRVRSDLMGRLGVEEFATAPLVAKDRVVGVIVVDNRWTGRPIGDEDLEMLSIFATNAALALEGARVYRRLEEAHRDLQDTYHQLVQQEKLAALGEMAANVVHEIRNPLVSIGGFARRLLRRVTDAETPEARYAEIIVREVDRLERILGDVLALSRRRRVEPTEVDLNAIAEDCLVLFEERVDKQGVAIRKTLWTDPLPVRGEAAQIKQALVNLVANGLEAMPAGGELVLRTCPEGRWGVVEVSDTGGGIPREVEARIFEPFFTTKEQGTGLGLAVAQRIAQAHGGRVDVANVPGVGATFRLRFPLAGAGEDP